MGSTEVERLHREIMAKSPADRFRLAAMLCDAGKPAMALSVAKSACAEIEYPIVMAKLKARPGV